MKLKTGVKHSDDRFRNMSLHDDDSQRNQYTREVTKTADCLYDSTTNKVMNLETWSDKTLYKIYQAQLPYHESERVIMIIISRRKQLRSRSLNLLIRRQTCFLTKSKRDKMMKSLTLLQFDSESQKTLWDLLF